VELLKTVIRGYLEVELTSFGVIDINGMCRIIGINCIMQIYLVSKCKFL